MSAEIVETKTVYQGWAKYLIADIRLADGQHIKREIEHHGDAIAVLPYDPARKVAILVRQLRAPVLLAAKDDATAQAAGTDRVATRGAIAAETADLLFHALVLLAERDLPPAIRVRIASAPAAVSPKTTKTSPSSKWALRS